MSSALAPLQSALDPHGPVAAGIAGMTWVLTAGAAVILVLVVVLAAWAVISPRPWLASKSLVIGGGIVFPVVTLTLLLAYTLHAAPILSSKPEVVIEVVGRQWWWQVNYLGAGGQPDFATANEIRIPAGRVVELRLRSVDVLHSLWVPSLAGKLDLVPGRENRLRLSADRPGRYRGQCAEYCGGPHGLMALFVVAEESAQFDAWRAAQRAPQRAAGGARGKELFASHCSTCHTVRGTSAQGVLGPDLTHFASRVSLGAGILPNDAASVSKWIAANQHIKPGNLMPEFRAFSGEEMQHLTAYLQTLQ